MSKEPELLDLIKIIRDMFISELKQEGKIVVTPKDFKSVYFPDRKFSYLGEIVDLKITKIKVTPLTWIDRNPTYQYTNHDIIPGQFFERDYIEKTIKPTWERVRLGLHESVLALYQKHFRAKLLYIDTNNKEPNAWYKPTIKKMVSPETFDIFKDFYDE
jgi:hypothetical protein